jgi:hypothetical protein
MMKYMMVTGDWWLVTCDWWRLSWLVFWSFNFQWLVTPNVRNYRQVVNVFSLDDAHATTGSRTLLLWSHPYLWLQWAQCRHLYHVCNRILNTAWIAEEVCKYSCSQPRPTQTWMVPRATRNSTLPPNQKHPNFLQTLSQSATRNPDTFTKTTIKSKATPETGRGGP